MCYDFLLDFRNSLALTGTHSQVYTCMFTHACMRTYRCHPEQAPTCPIRAKSKGSQHCWATSRHYLSSISKPLAAPPGPTWSPKPSKSLSH